MMDLRSLGTRIFVFAIDHMKLTINTLVKSFPLISPIILEALSVEELLLLETPRIPTMDIHSRPFKARDIASKADVESLESYAERIGRYVEKDYSYIPMPIDDCFYNVQEEASQELLDSQFIDRDAHLMEAIQCLEEQIFLIIDLEPAHYLVDLKDPHIRAVYDEPPERSLPADADLFSPDEVRTEFRELAERELRRYDERYMIITLADLNRRRVREMLYVVIGGLSSELASRIELYHPDSRSLFKYLREGTIGRWEKENLKDLNLHIAEHMTLVGMMQVIQGSDSDFVKSCGFESKKDVQTLNVIKKIRNRVMHPNRSLVYDRDDVGEVVEAIEEAQRILNGMSDINDFP